MNKRWNILALAVAFALCILFIGGPAFAVDVPEKLKDIPLYQGSTVRQAMDMTNHTMLIATVKASGSDVADFYKKAMAAKGWKLAFNAEQEEMKLLHFQKDKMVFQVTIQIPKGEEETTYNLVLTAQQ
jgi:hypothetical protein